MSILTVRRLRRDKIKMIEALLDIEAAVTLLSSGSGGDGESAPSCADQVAGIRFRWRYWVSAAPYPALRPGLDQT